jgi:hypothetical protein
MNAPTTDPTPAGAAEPRDPPVRFGRICWAAFAGPGAWAVDLVARYFLVESGVAGPHELAVMTIGIVAVLIAAASSIVCAGMRRRARGHGADAELLASLGVALGAFTALVIGAELVPHYFFDGLSPP